MKIEQIEQIASYCGGLDPELRKRLKSASKKTVQLVTDVLRAANTP